VSDRRRLRAWQYTRSRIASLDPQLRQAFAAMLTETDRSALGVTGAAIATIERPSGLAAEHATAPAEGWDRIARCGLRCIERIHDARFPYHFIVRAARRT
jgi:hypothetical protein